MKYIKYILLAVLVVFVIKSVEAFTPMGNNQVVEEYTYNAEDIEKIDVDVKNANVTIVKSESDEIQVVTELTDYQLSKFKYSVGIDNRDKTLDVSVYTYNNFVEEINSYGNVIIRVPKDKNIKTSNVNIKAGQLEYNVNTDILNVTGDSLKNKVSGVFGEVNIKQDVGVFSGIEISATKMQLEVAKGAINLKSAFSQDMQLAGKNYTTLDVYRSFFNKLELKGGFRNVKFYEIDDANVEIENAKINKTNLELVDGKYIYKSEGKEKGMMKMNANNVVIDEFYIQGV